MDVELGTGWGGRSIPGPPVCTQNRHPCLRGLVGHQERLWGRVFCNLQGALGIFVTRKAKSFVPCWGPTLC